jgi:zinc transport system substrate-binding protein
MIQKIQTALGVQQEKMLRITTQYDWPSLRTSVLKIAEAAGTTAKAEEHLHRIEAWYRNAKQELEKQGLLGVPVLVHLFQKPFAEELGFEIRGVFGPAPLEARQIGEAAKHRVHFILDNKHNPVATPVSEVLPNATYCQLINFPGSEGTVSLEDVLQYNLNALLK